MNILPYIRHKIVVPLLLFITFLLVFPARAVTVKYHTSFDNSPVRIIDTQDYTFFQVLQKEYDKTKTSYSLPYSSGLVYLKKEPERGIFPAHEWLKLNGSSIRTCEYSPEGKFLVVLYMDGGIDIITDAGVVRHNDMLRTRSLPGWSNIQSMTLSGNEIWIAAGKGYIVIDGTTGRTLAMVDLKKKIERIVRCGDRMIALVDGALTESVTTKYPRSMADFKPVSADGGTKRLFLPLADGFLYLGDKLNTGNSALYIARKKDSKWETSHLTDLWLPTVESKAVITNTYEKNFVRNKTGWIVSTEDDICFVSYGSEEKPSGEIERVNVVSKENPTTGRRISLAGSWDTNSMWTYCDRGRFSQGERDENKFLVDDAGSMRPAVPASFQTLRFAVSPSFGTIGVTHGYDQDFISYQSILPPLTSGYKDGSWTVYDHAYNKPRSAEQNEELNALYEANRNRFPLANPYGISVDPIMDNFVWIGGIFGGMAALDLSDPKSDPLHFGSPADPLAQYSGFLAILPDAAGWKGYSPLSCPSFDGEGTLWAASNNMDAADYGSPSPGRLYYWKKENRQKVLQSGNVEDASGIGYIEFPTSQFNATMKGLALRKDVNRNLIMVFTFSQPRNVLRVNHQGTLENWEDDVTDKFHIVEDQFGGRWEFDYIHSMEEDPVTGKVWLGEHNTLFIIDPTSEISSGTIKGEVLDLEYGENRGNPLSRIQVNGIVFDEYGRAWLSTTGNGVWGISADRKKVIAHYTARENSLLSDTAYGIAWNPDSQSLMVSTMDGYCEIFPDKDDISVNYGHQISVYPREVKPDYTGAVVIRGLEPGAEVTVTDKVGKEIVRIVADPEGRAAWNLTENGGEKVKTGIYYLTGNFGRMELPVLR